LQRFVTLFIFTAFIFICQKNFHIKAVARNETLENKVRLALAGLPDVVEKQMFRGTAFMVNGKLCISAGNNELMFSFDPALHESLVQQQDCREMLRSGKVIKGYL
jgi:hypothetical protein